MFDFLMTSQAEEALSFGNTLLIIISSLILGFFISLVYIFTHKKEGYSSGFTATLIMLPAIISMIILLIGSNVARAFSLAGAFSLIRFRSEPGDPKDIAYVFFSLGVGLSCGMGYIGYAAVFCVIMCAVMTAMYVLNFPKEHGGSMSVRITIPENVDYTGLFDGVFDEYTDGYRFRRVKTVDFGSLFEVEYLVDMKKNANHKEFIDKLRCMNNNLNISLSAAETRM